jgi:hypothetical protein
MNYGAVNGSSTESVQRCCAMQRSDRNRNGLAWSIKTIVGSLMTISVVCFLWSGMGEQSADRKTLAVRLNELKQISRSHLARFNSWPMKPLQSLDSKDAASYGRYAEDMKDGKEYLPVPSGLFKVPMKVQCSDTVSWGRLQCAFVLVTCFYMA